jgi:hypothetical protein
MDQQNPFKWRHFEAEIILLCVRWYLYQIRLSSIQRSRPPVKLGSSSNDFRMSL